MRRVGLAINKLEYSVMMDDRDLSVVSLINRFPGKITATALMVLGENVLMALIPLMIGLTIDGLLEGNSAMVWDTAGILLLLTLFYISPLKKKVTYPRFVRRH